MAAEKATTRTLWKVTEPVKLLTSGMARTVEKIADSPPEEAGAVEVRMDSNKENGHRPPKETGRAGHFPSRYTEKIMR